MTQVLLELCRLRGWAVVGMCIDYVKCFDLIPQAVVLGMDTGTCRALGAMYTSSSAGPSRSPGPSACGGRPPMASLRDAPCH